MSPARAHLPLLSQVVRDLGPTAENSGLCFHRAAALVLDMPSADFCVGALRAATADEIAAEPRCSPVPFLHAWVERGGVVYAPTLIEALGGLCAIPRQVYYRTNGVGDVYRINRAAVKRLAARHGWAQRAAFGARTEGQAPVGSVLLEAAGVPFRIVDGVALPAQASE